MAWIENSFVYVNVAEIKAETEKAFLMKLKHHNKPIWLPKSQVSDAEDYNVGDTDLGISITAWIAEQHGIQNEEIE